MDIKLTVTHVCTQARRVHVTTRVARMAAIRSALGKQLWAGAAVVTGGVSSRHGDVYPRSSQIEVYPGTLKPRIIDNSNKSIVFCAFQPPIDILFYASITVSIEMLMRPIVTAISTLSELRGECHTIWEIRRRSGPVFGRMFLDEPIITA
ncbi:hypothetical protein JB92DRAFT_2831356 [Gautieria morchelliformis]|nr:hypothetical protein JB92DRAFT_2831356 [Gautieria morchelliformis]